jgi:hypothetical protein
MMSHDTILLSDSQVNQLIISVHFDWVQAVLELGTKASAETIPLLSISVSMIIRILTQVIESLRVLKHYASTLSKS